ncbi:unnamed protein product [Brassica napus]|uniref:(rape) hypothetical protein n=1 Tax=Brassica napus TaxID=3708 RepID=A0A816I7U8_BRANA|nr:unnamed protein product [Brassica napus]
MGLVVYWYDFICFGIVLAAIVASLWFLLCRERGCVDVEDTTHNSFLQSRSGSESLGSARLRTSCWRGLHPGWLLFTRSISFLSMAALLAWDVLEWDASIFVYYTECVLFFIDLTSILFLTCVVLTCVDWFCNRWTFMLVMIYFAMGIVASLYGCLENYKEPTSGVCDDAVGNKVGDGEFRERLGVYGCFMETIFQTSAGAVVLTDVVFWLVIVPFLSNTHLGLNTLMICMHTANAGFLILDTLLNSLPFPWFRMGYFVIWSCLYIVFQWIIHACGLLTWWPYPFLELDRPWAPLWYATTDLKNSETTLICLTIVDSSERQGVKGVLSWYQRVEIAVSTARALECLHDKANPHIIHRDTKSSNVLLFEDDVAKVSDFDLSDQATAMASRLYSTHVLGTFVYHASE